MKKIWITLVSAIALTMFISTSANASHYKRAYVTRNITVYKFIRGDSYATSHLGHHLKLHYGKNYPCCALLSYGKGRLFLESKRPRIKTILCTNEQF